MREWKHSSLFEMTYFMRKERQTTAAGLKRLKACKSEKYCNEKMGYLIVYYDKMIPSQKTQGVL